MGLKNDTSEAWEIKQLLIPELSSLQSSIFGFQLKYQHM